jgi:hypothetical protein
MDSRRRAGVAGLEDAAEHVVDADLGRDVGFGA